MEITIRDAITVVHGMFFGALLLLSFTGGAIGLYTATAARGSWNMTDRQQKLFSTYLAIMALLAWITVFLGAYVVYPWYRAVPPAGTINLAGYPQHLLLSSPDTSGWHSIGMEWKEHLAWFAPISLTAVAYIFAHYGTQLRVLKSLRNAVAGLIALAFVAACVSGFFGAMLNKNAAVRGGANLVLMQGPSHGK
ncbi:MAG: hypothetical protein ACRET0_03155 [Steroidobacteraceae bacterium]